MQFLPIGLDKVWLRLDGGEEYELAEALGFSFKFGGFTTADFAIRVDRLGKMIGIDIDVDIQYNNDKDSGKTTHKRVLGSF